MAETTDSNNYQKAQYMSLLNKHKAVLICIIVFVLLFLQVSPLMAGGNTQFRNPANLNEVFNKLWDTRALPVEWVLSKDGIPASGITNATLASELTAAFDSWENLSASILDFQYGGEVDLRETGLSGSLGAGIDGKNLITFTDPNVLFPVGVLAVAFTFSFTQDTVITDANNDLDGDGTPDIPNGTYRAGTIFDGDIAFNSSEPWSISGANGAIDIRAVALHEIGHFFGLAHSCIRDAVMWPFLSSDITSARTMKADDIAYASYYYPSEPNYSNAFGSIQGYVTNGFSNGPVLGAHVFAVDPLSGQSVAGAYSGDDGKYFIPGLSAGNYLVAIEPLDGDPAGLDPFRINEVVQFTTDTNFPEEFYDANEANVEADPMAGLAVPVHAGAATAGINVVTNTLVVPGVSIILNSGYNLFAYPVEAPSDLKAFSLLQALGSPSEVNSIDCFVPETGTFERAQFVNGIPEGINFLVMRGEGYVIHMNAQKVVDFSGATDCPNLSLKRGMNLVGIPCPPAAYTAFNLLHDIGSQFEVQKIERFNSVTGMYETAMFDAGGIAGGTNFPIKNGEGYIIYMFADKSGVKIPAAGSSFAPVITSLSPGRGVPGSIVLISGEGFSPDATKNTVTFNSIGAGVIFSTSTTLTVTVPAGAVTGPVRVIVNGRFSNSIDFVVETQTVQEDPAGNTELVSGQTANGSISAEGEQDRYQFIALAGSLVTINAQSVTAGVPDLVLLLEDPHGIIVASDDNSGGGTDPRINNFELKSTGVFTIVVSNVPGSGTGPYKLSLSIITRSAPPQISIIGGNYQTGLAGSILPAPLEVFITGPTGAPVSGSAVSFVASEVVINGSTVNPQNAGTTVINTNASGIVSVQTTLSAATGNYIITVSAPGAASVSFTVAATNTAITSITMNGDRQTGTVDQNLANPLEVILRNAAGNPVSGALVAFLTVSGGGSVAPAGAQNTSAAGKASTVFKLGTLIKDAQLVAAFVPGQSKPLLFEAYPKAAAPSRIRSNRTNFNRMTFGTSRLNAIQVEVFDQYDNPVEGTTVTYTAPAGFTVSPGLGPKGIFFTDFKTNKDGLHVAMLTAGSAKPTIDEFGSNGATGLASIYSISAQVASLSQTFRVDVDMGPVMVTGSTQNDSALIGQPLANPVKKLLLRYERRDTYTDTNSDGIDDDNGDFRDENFNLINENRIQGVVVNFSVEREDGKRETDVGLQPTRTGVPSATSDINGYASTGVTMGDVGGVNQVIGSINVIPVTWYFADGTVITSMNFTDGNRFAESTNLFAIPVIITTTVSDTGSGIDFATLKAWLNGSLYFDGSTPPAVLPDFKDKLELIAGGKVYTTIDPNLNIVTDSAFTLVEIKYYPSAPRLAPGINTVIFNKVKDKIENQQGTNVVQTFTYP
ncbi:MAG: hypothetical protein A2W28_12745 [Gammaproteobacteria bacterium RBG_16_51_14]|nr:MAG: hypothetical protein A2W28_12745 [Gammaproteobacteria bacterium RBG_16_51_14]